MLTDKRNTSIETVMGGVVSEHAPVVGGITSALAGFSASMAAATIPEALAMTVRIGFADCVAVMVAGWDEASPRLIRANFPASGSGDAVGLAAIYGTAAHALDYDDVAFGNHPSAVLVPALFAAAHERRISGAAAMRAYVAGYEIWADLSGRDADPLHAKGWHPTASYGPIAAAAAVACAWGLGEAQTLNAIAISASLTGGVVGNFGSMTKPFHVGRAAQAGVIAARAAAAGLTASTDVIESEQGLLRALSPRGQVDLSPPRNLAALNGLRKHALSIKLSPICYAAHRIVDATRELRSRGFVDPKSITRIEVELGDTQSKILREYCPETASGAKFSVEFAVAATWLAGQCGLAELMPDFIQARPVQDLMRRVTRRTVTARDPVEPMHAPFDRVTIELADGTRMISSDVAYAEGHRLRPATPARLRGKFESCVIPRFGSAGAARLFDLAMGLDTLEELKDLADEAAPDMVVA